MTKRKIDETIHTIRYEGEERPLQVRDIPKDLLPDDIIVCESDPGFCSENNSWDAFTNYYVIRFRDETDEEHQVYLEKCEIIKERLKKERYERYLELKKEFDQ